MPEQFEAHRIINIIRNTINKCNTDIDKCGPHLGIRPVFVAVFGRSLNDADDRDNKVIHTHHFIIRVGRSSRLSHVVIGRALSDKQPNPRLSNV